MLFASDCPFFLGVSDFAHGSGSASTLGLKVAVARTFFVLRRGHPKAKRGTAQEPGKPRATVASSRSGWYSLLQFPVVD